MKRVPVHVVTGAPQSGAGALVKRLTGQRGDWAALAPSSCPCCVGRVELQVTLARLLRERQPRRILVSLAQAEHRKAFERVLAESPLSEHVVAARSLLLPADAELRPEDLEAD